MRLQTLVNGTGIARCKHCRQHNRLQPLPRTTCLGLLASSWVPTVVHNQVSRGGYCAAVDPTALGLSIYIIVLLVCGSRPVMYEGCMTLLAKTAEWTSFNSSMCIQLDSLP